MDMKRLEQGLDLWAEIVRIQHEIIRLSPDGKIEINDPRMWAECLDLLDNQHWELIFETIAAVESQVFFRPHQTRMILEATEYYRKNRNRSPRAMDINRNYKKPSWGCIMAMREIWDEI
jgi:hypothetical protein